MPRCRRHGYPPAPRHILIVLHPHGMPINSLFIFRTCSSPMLEEATLLVVRALRNAVPLGQPAVQAIVHGGAATSVAEVASRLGAYTERSESSTGEDQAKQVQLLAAACAQLLANLASSGTVGADAVWSACFPYAFLALLRCEQGVVMTPSTRAKSAMQQPLIAPCCSASLCGCAVSNAWSSNLPMACRPTAGGPAGTHMAPPSHLNRPVLPYPKPLPTRSPGPRVRRHGHGAVRLLQTAVRVQPAVVRDRGTCHRAQHAHRRPRQQHRPRDHRCRQRCGRG